jgi:hypothetical protein
MIRYSLSVIWQLIITNPIKITALVIAIISWNYAGSFQNGTYKEPVVSEVKDGSTWIYLTRNSGSSSGYEVMTSTTKEKLVDGSLVLDDYNGINVVFWAFFVISALIFSITTIIGWINDDGVLSLGWDLDGCLVNSLNNIIYCELEDGVYYYMAFGRLIGKSDRQINPRRVSDHFNTYSLSDLRKCPRFSTKTQNRNNLLDKLGI